MKKVSVKEIKEIQMEAHGAYPKNVLAGLKKGLPLFIHQHGNVDVVEKGGNLLSRTRLVKVYGKDLIVVEMDNPGGVEEGHVFLGVSRVKEIANAYIEKIDGNLAYIICMSSEAVNG